MAVLVIRGENLAALVVGLGVFVALLGRNPALGLLVLGGGEADPE